MRWIMGGSWVDHDTCTWVVLKNTGVSPKAQERSGKRT
jgi:hypothetical protein